MCFNVGMFSIFLGLKSGLVGHKAPMTGLLAVIAWMQVICGVLLELKYFVFGTYRSVLFQE